MIILDEKTKQALLNYKKGQLKFDHLAHLCATKAKKVPVVDIDNPTQLTQKDFVYIDNAATAPLLLPVKLFAESLEINFRSNYGRSYGQRPPPIEGHQNIEQCQAGGDEAYGSDGRQ